MRMNIVAGFDGYIYYNELLFYLMKASIKKDIL